MVTRFTDSAGQLGSMSRHVTLNNFFTPDGAQLFNGKTLDEIDIGAGVYAGDPHADWNLDVADAMAYGHRDLLVTHLRVDKRKVVFSSGETIESEFACASRERASIEGDVRADPFESCLRPIQNNIARLGGIDPDLSV